MIDPAIASWDPLKHMIGMCMRTYAANHGPNEHFKLTIARSKLMILMGNALFTDYPYINSNILTVVRNFKVAGDLVHRGLKLDTWFVSENGYGMITRLQVPSNSDEVFSHDVQ